MKTFPSPYPKTAAAGTKPRSFRRSAGFAWRGIRVAFEQEPNLRRQLAVGLLILIAGVMLRVTFAQLAILILTSAAVLILELLNSALEALADATMPHYHDKIRNAKDMAAGAVLIMSIAAVAVGVVILLPPLINLLAI